MWQGLLGKYYAQYTAHLLTVYFKYIVSTSDMCTSMCKLNVFSTLERSQSLQ